MFTDVSAYFYFFVCLTSNKLYWIQDQLADISTRFYTSASWRRRVGPSASWSVGELTGYRFENINGNLAIDNPGAGSSFPLSQCQIRIRIMNFGFCGRRKTGGLGEKPFGRMRTNNKLNPQVTPGLGIKPWPQWSEARALTISLSLLPVCSWINIPFYFTY